MADPAALPDQLRHVYWIGGSAGAGKSTMARRIATQYGMHLYSTDDVMSDHDRRLAPESAPYLAAFKAMDMDERWANRSPQIMLETFHWYRGEGFGLIVEDLVRLPADLPVVAEGFRLLPHLVKPLLADPSHAIWLLPTPAFRRAAFDSRGTTWNMPRRTTNPQRALDNHLQRERLFTERLREETKRLELPVIELAVGIGVDLLHAKVAQAFGL